MPASSASSPSCLVLPEGGPEERLLLLVPELRGLHIGIDVFLGLVVGRHVVPLAAFLVEPEPPAFPLGIVVLDVHPERGLDPGERVEADGDQRPVASRLDSGPSAALMLSDERSRASSSFRTGVLPFFTTCFGPRTAWAGLIVDDVAEDEPVEEHPDGGQVLLDRGGLVRERELLDVGRDVVAPDVLQGEPPVLAPAEEAAGVPEVRARGCSGCGWCR